MNPEQVFSAASAVAMLGWVALCLAGRKPMISGVLTGMVIPLLLAVAYTTLVV